MKSHLPTPAAPAADILPAPTQPTRQRDIAAAWAAELQAEAAAGMKSRATVAAYLSHAATWLDWLDAGGVSVPTPAHVLAWVADIRDGRKPASVNAHLSAVRAMYAWAEARNIYPAIARSVRGLRVAKSEPLEALTPAQLAGLLDMVGGDGLAARRDRALVQCMYATACRLTSLHGANVGDVDLLDAAITYRGKGDAEKGRRAYLSPSALDAVRVYLAARRAANGGTLPPDAPLFAATGNRAGGARMSTRSMRRVIVRLMEAAGHVHRDEAGHITRPRVLSAHSIRRTAVTAAYDSAGLDAAQTLAGHADPRTTRQAYARVQRGKILRGLSATLDLPQTQTEKD